MPDDSESVRDMVFHAMDAGLIWLSPDFGDEENGRWSDQMIADHLMKRRKFKATSMLEAKVLLVPIRQWREANQQYECHKVKGK